MKDEQRQIQTCFCTLSHGVEPRGKNKHFCFTFFQIVSQFHYFYSSNSIRTRRRVHSCRTFHLSLDSVADSELYSKRKWDYWRKLNCSNNFTTILPSQTQLSSVERNGLVMDWAKCISIMKNIRGNAKWEAKDGVVWICGGISRN